MHASEEAEPPALPEFSRWCGFWFFVCVFCFEPGDPSAVCIQAALPRSQLKPARAVGGHVARAVGGHVAALPRCCGATRAVDTGSDGLGWFDMWAYKEGSARPPFGSQGRNKRAWRTLHLMLVKSRFELSGWPKDDS